MSKMKQKLMTYNKFMHQKMKGTPAKIDDELDKTSGPPLHRKYFNLGTICYKVLTIGGHYDYSDNN